MRGTLDRRSFVGLAAAAGVSLVLPRHSGAQKLVKAAKMMTRPIPKTGEALPVIGLGTYGSFDVAAGQRAPLVEVMRRFLELGGRVIDSSPMYGQSEAAIGEVLGTLGRPKVFLATKVWTTGKAEGEKQMAESARLLGAPVDLMQIHNLVDWKTHMATLRAMKEKGTIRYIGVTHYATSAFAEMEQLCKSGAIDFIQIPYSIAEREAEKRLLPAAAANQVAVLVMRPFERAGLFAKVKGKALPPWAADLGVTSWAQLFLKFIVGHPAVTAPIPATANVKHLEENISGGVGPLPDEAQRKQMLALI